MTVAVWPESLPAAILVAGGQYQPLSNATAYPVEAGELLTRRRFTGTMARIPASLLLTVDQARALLIFYREDLAETLPFLWTDPLTGEDVEMVFDGAPQFQAISTDLFQATLTLIVKPALFGNDRYTKSLLLFRGDSGDTAIYDSNYGGSEHVWTAAGNAQISDGVALLGGNMLLLDGAGDWATTPHHADYALGSSPFAAETFFVCTAAGGSQEEIAGQCDSVAGAATRSFLMFRSTTNEIRGVVRTAGGSDLTVVGSTQFTDALNTGLHHAAFVRTTDDFLKLFIDGVQNGSSVAVSGAINLSTNNLSVGRLGEATGNPWTGRLGMFRLSIGVDRLKADGTFPVPTRRYEG